MAFVVAPRRPGSKPSLLASMPAELFGKFEPNGKGSPTPTPAPKVEKRRVKGDKSQLAHPKPAPAKPGKGAPTKKERAWLDAIVRYGCIACRMDGLGVRPAAVHHILRAGRRIGHLFTLPLCDPGHHQSGAATGMVSRHPNKAQFEKQYGTEAELLAQLQSEIRGAK